MPLLLHFTSFPPSFLDVPAFILVACFPTFSLSVFLTFSLTFFVNFIHFMVVWSVLWADLDLGIKVGDFIFLDFICFNQIVC